VDIVPDARIATIENGVDAAYEPVSGRAALRLFFCTGREIDIITAQSPSAIHAAKPDG
jgi:hypothetical protein